MYSSFCWFTFLPETAVHFFENKDAWYIFSKWYSRMVSLTCIYPGTIQFHLAINTKSEHNRSMPNQWTRSAINVLHGHKYVIDQCQTNGRDQLSMSLHGHKHLIDQTNGHDQLSMPLLGHKHFIDQCQTNGHDQLSMSSWTQALNRSTPNQWAQSAINVPPWTQALNWSMPNRWDDQLSMSSTDTST